MCPAKSADMIHMYGNLAIKTIKSYMYVDTLTKLLDQILVKPFKNLKCST